ncbi:helix-turn-helix transcriptional regulator [Amycolatopsis minnesotensis]|uniref:Helix-turn-helix transcriptional regulator n=1 Tax=Amycolatopsis minnesotensis TaxID=337894 RepID=A0ABN2T0C9_9PSEU
MTDHETTVRSRELGEALRAALQKAGLTGKELAHRLEWSPSEVSRMLSGKRTARESDVAALLGFCGVGGKEHARLIALCREANQPGWWQRYGSHLPKHLRTYLDHEDKATAVFEYSPLLVPGSLQTGGYAREIIANAVNIPADEVEERVAARLARASIFSRSRAANFTFIVAESVLRLPIGGVVVMSEQLHYLLRMSVRSNVSLRVIPTEAGAHIGTGGPFTLLEFADIRPVAYLENHVSSLFIEERDETSVFRRIRTALAKLALPEAQSRDLIGNLAIELYQDGEDSDERS